MSDPINSENLGHGRARSAPVWCAAAVLVCLAAAGFAGCGRAAGRVGQTIYPADLTQKEQDIFELYGGEGSSRIFEFASGKLKAASVRLKVLTADGQWMDHGRAVLGSLGRDGRILVTTSDGWQTVKMVMQDSEGTESVSFQPGDSGETGRMEASSWLSEPADVEEGKEIPLLIHAESGGDSIESFGMAGFDDTAMLAGNDYVFAVTVTFTEP